MKTFIFSLAQKTIFIKNLLGILLISIFVSSAYSETSSLSLQNGLGLEQPNYANQSIGTGYAGIASTNKSGVSLRNLSRTAFNTVTSLELGINRGLTHFTSNSSSTLLNYANLTNAALVIKVGSWGAITGVYQQRFSSDFEIQTADSSSASQFSRDGEIFEIGTGYALPIHPALSVAVGIYSLSGSVQDVRTTDFNNDLFLTQVDTTTNLYRGSRFNVSTTFRSLYFNFAVSLDFPIFLNNRQSIRFTNQLNNNENTTTNSFTIPLRYTFGGNLKFSKNKNLVLDLGITLWDQKLTQLNQKFFPHIGAGYEYSGSLNPFTKYSKRIGYRFGVGFEQIPNAQANIFRLTGGIRLPVQKEGFVDINLEAGVRSWDDAFNSQEQFIKLHFSFVGITRS